MRTTGLIVACVASILAIACGGGSAEPPGAGSGSPGAAPVAAAAPAAVPVATTPGDLFPEDPQKAAVMNSCGSCHNLACSVIGQRTAERWDSLQKAHADRVADADVAAMFAYLKTHFNSSTPEPVVPPAFLDGGCTPF